MSDREAIDVLFNELKCIDRNNGINCDRKCESCNLVMDVEIIREAYNMAISALEKQIPKKPTVPVDTWLCPSCGEPVEYQQKLGDNVLYHGQHDFCPKCGQAISWEEE